jgi:fatty acid desaturase
MNLMNNLSAKTILADPAMRELLKPNNCLATRDLILRLLVELILMFVIYLLFYRDQLIIALFFFYMLAIWHSFWGYAGIGHEFMHGRVFSNNWVNRMFYYLSSALVWSNPSFFRFSHLHHHAKTFSGDDFEAKGIQQWQVKDVISYATIDIPFMLRRIFYTLINSFGYLYSDGIFRKIPKGYQQSAVLTLFIQTLITVCIYKSTGSLVLSILWILVPFTGQLLNRVLAHSQHIGLADHRDLGPLRHSRSIRLPKMLTYLYAGMNYHVEHHLMPAVPYYNLEKLSQYLVRVHGHAVEEWRPFFSSQFLKLVSRHNLNSRTH